MHKKKAIKKITMRHVRGYPNEVVTRAMLILWVSVHRHDARALHHMIEIEDEDDLYKLYREISHVIGFIEEKRKENVKRGQERDKRRFQ